MYFRKMYFRKMYFRNLSRVLLCAAALLPAACGSLKPGPVTVTDGGMTNTDLSHIDITDEGNGVHGAVVDAHDDKTWIYLDLETNKEVAPADAAHDSVWDLSFQRFMIRTNGGTSGSGGGSAARLEGVTFAALTTAPATGYVNDSDAGGQSETGPAYAFLVGDGWYSYNVSTHKLTARDVLYVVKTPEGHYFKVQVENYYDEAGDPGHLKFRWASVAAPTADKLTVDASSTTAWAYVQLGADGKAVAGDDMHWDLAFQSVMIRTNGGTSGSGFGGAQAATAAYMAISDAPTIGYTIDDQEPIAGPPGSGTISANPVLSNWYDYNSSTHMVSPHDGAFLVRTTAGRYAKLKIATFDQSKNTFTIQFEPVSRHVSVVTQTVDASNSMAWVALSLRKGGVVTVADLSTSQDWDIALSRTLARTNSGTSGPGSAGAVDMTVATFTDVLTAATTGYVIDDVEPLPGPPGSGTASMNAALSAWYNYDPATHTVSPKPTTYAVKAADGSFAKLQITSWADGMLGITYAYAGPGQAGF